MTRETAFFKKIEHEKKKQNKKREVKVKTPAGPHSKMRQKRISSSMSIYFTFLDILADRRPHRPSPLSPADATSATETQLRWLFWLQSLAGGHSDPGSNHSRSGSCHVYEGWPPGASRHSLCKRAKYKECTLTEL